QLVRGPSSGPGNQVRRLKTDDIKLDIEVEDLARFYPDAVGFLTRRGVRCIRCGEPVWGSLGELLEQDHIADPQGFVDDLNVFLRNQKEIPDKR
ncbi:MAG: hypothetical protein MUP70_11055, partial [Candidatus Aminicenantes bacterium]|nr:hypothetical protein [Candidatus Aminicenantes bacterium]